MKCWTWVSSRRDGSPVCFLWICLSTIQRSLCVISWPSTECGWSGIQQRPRNSRNSGFIWRTCFKHHFINRKGHLREFITYDLHRLPGGPLHSSVWCCLSAIRQSLCMISWPLTKYESTGIQQRPKNGRNSEFTQATCSDEEEDYRPKRPFTVIHQEWYTTITRRRVAELYPE